ncbi:MAG: hypothetical protein AAF720_01380 [Pseudomonadota bacterium]
MAHKPQTYEQAEKAKLALEGAEMVTVDASDITLPEIHTRILTGNQKNTEHLAASLMRNGQIDTPLVLKNEDGSIEPVTKPRLTIAAQQNEQQLVARMINTDATTARYIQAISQGHEVKKSPAETSLALIFAYEDYMAAPLKSESGQTIGFAAYNEQEADITKARTNQRLKPALALVEKCGLEVFQKIAGSHLDQFNYIKALAGDDFSPDDIEREIEKSRRAKEVGEEYHFPWPSGGKSGVKGKKSAQSKDAYTKFIANFEALTDEMKQRFKLEYLGIEEAAPS